MKRVLAWLLLLTLVLGTFAGCKNTEVETTKPQTPEATAPVETAPNGVKGPSAQNAMDYVQSLYMDGGSQTPVDYKRYGIVRVGGIEFKIEWSVDVGEDLVKIVPNEDGTVTIDINEQCQEDTPYVLTATITDADGNTATHSWNYILPKAQDMVEIVKNAYALKPGESLPYESRLIGKIKTIDTIWNDEFQNITVTIVVEGAEDMPIKCYRMKANESTLEQIKELRTGNIITVLGTLKNYEGTIEFDAGCILEKVEKGDAKEALTDPGEILKAAYALKEGESIPDPVTLKGTVTEIDAPYDPNYGNISVVIEVEGYEQYPILCYRLKGTGVDEIAVNDLITVTGIIKNYKGTIEYDAGCIMTERISGGGVAQKPSSDAAKILADAAKLGVGEKLPYRATLTGVVTSVDTPYSAQYANVTVTMKVNGVKIQCYRMVGDGIDQIRETDTITVTGVIENYNGKLEFGAKCNLDAWSKGPRNVNYGYVQEDVAYKLYMNQGAIDKTLYFNGSVSGSRLSTTANGVSGADVFAERHNKGLRFYYMSGNTKNYIEIEEYTNDKGQQRGRALVTTTPSCYWVYDSDTGVYVVNLPTAGKYFLGTYNTYETITASWLGYIDGTMNGSNQYVAKFIKSSEVSDSGSTGTVVQGTPVADPAVGTGYKFGFQQNMLDGKPFLGFNGKMAGFYYGTADKIDGMVDVYLEEADGGYHLYFMDGNTKTYLDVVPRDNDATKVNVVFSTSGTHSVYQLNTQYKYVYTQAVGKEWYLGTYSQNSSISASLTSYISDTSTIGVSQFCAWFCNVEEVEAPEEPTEPTPGAEATMVTDPVVETAYKMGMNISGTIYYFTGNTDGVSYRLATSTNAADAIDVMLESTDNGYYLYFMKGNTKTYIQVYHRLDGDPGYGKGSLELVTSAPAEVFTYDETANTLVYDYDGNNAYYMGTFGTYTNISVSNTFYITGNNASNIDVSQFPVHFYTVEGVEDPSEPSEPTQPSEPSEPSGDVVGDIEVGKPYKWGIEQETLGVTLYFNGEMAKTYYGGTTQNIDEAVDVILESADNGYYITFTDASGAKKYINVVVNGTHRNFTIANAPASVYTYDETYQTLLTDVDGTICYIGTYGNYDTFSVSPLEKIETSFPSHLYEISEDVPTDPTEPSEPTDPEIPDDLEYMLVAIWSGEHNVAMKSLNETQNYGYMKGTAVSLEGDLLTGIDEYNVFIMVQVPDTEYWIIGDAYGRVLYMTGTFDSVNVSAEEPEDGYLWTVTSAGGDAYYITNATTGKTFGYDTGYGSFGVYAEEAKWTPLYISEVVFEEDPTDPTEPSQPEVTEPEATQPSGSASLKNGDQVVIYAPAYNKALSADKVTEGSFYNKGVDITVANGVVSGYGDAEIWTVTVNNDGTYSFANGGQNIGLADQYSSMNLGAIYDDWNLISLGGGLYNIQNVGRGNYMERYDAKGNWSTYNANNAASDGQFQMSIYVIGEGNLGGDTQEPEATEPEATQPSGDSAYVVEVVADKTYKWGIDQQNLGYILYFNGAMAKTYYGGTTQNTAEAVDVSLVASEAGGYYISFKDDSGATKYINIVVSGTYRNFTIGEKAETVYTWNKEYCTLVADVNGTECYIGTYGTFDTFSISSIDKIGTSFPSHFYEVGSEPSEPEASEPAPTEPEATEPEATNPSAGSTVKYVFSNYGIGEQYTTGENYELDAVTAMHLVGGHLNTQLRMYDDAKGDAIATFTCAKEITSVVINAGHRAASLEVYGSVDGETWVLVETIATERITTVSEYPDYTVEMPAGYKYLKLDAVGAQIRIPYIIFNFAN